MTEAPHGLRRLVVAGVAIIGALAGPAFAVPPHVFDLTCTGQTVGTDGGAAAFSMRLSIDRRGHRWCYRDAGCSRTFPIISDQADRLILLAVKTPLNEASLSVNLPDGAFSRDSVIPGRSSSKRRETGACALAAFTPIS